MIVAETTLCGIEVRRYRLRDLSATAIIFIVSQRVDGLHLITNGFRAPGFTVSQKSIGIELLRARLLPEAEFSNPLTLRHH
jgi:hypothetical protein